MTQHPSTTVTRDKPIGPERRGAASSRTFSAALMRTACADAIKKLDPRVQWHNPVMFVVYLGSLLTTGIWLSELFEPGTGNPMFTGWVSLWLWFTVLFATLA